jgi:hypothetical protein
MTSICNYETVIEQIIHMYFLKASGITGHGQAVHFDHKEKHKDISFFFFAFQNV